ncbi:unnamed protein product [Sphenostylis stenocarpa]|uniref:Uncharacterized protein n=1 Tax=Sphenostylis stenocarpa TaxID=92480 RepID=A0AA86W3K5_9FABA|nr:unnamed protein product [Sphenostylis stenocarpa]
MFVLDGEKCGKLLSLYICIIGKQGNVMDRVDGSSDVMGKFEDWLSNEEEFGEELRQIQTGRSGVGELVGEVDSLHYQECKCELEVLNFGINVSGQFPSGIRGSRSPFW